MFASGTARCAWHSSGGGRTLRPAVRRRDVLAVRIDNQAHADPDSPRLSNSGRGGLCCPRPPVTLFDETLGSGEIRRGSRKSSLESMRPSSGSKKGSRRALLSSGGTGLPAWVVFSLGPAGWIV